MPFHHSLSLSFELPSLFTSLLSSKKKLFQESFFLHLSSCKKAKEMVQHREDEWHERWMSKAQMNFERV